MLEFAEAGSMSPPATQQEPAKEPQQGDLASRVDRYKSLKANVRRRRAAYVAFIFLAIGLIALTLVDILMLSSGLKWIVVFPAWAVLIIIAIILLFSGKKHAETLEELRRLERSLLQCPDCQNVFRFGAVRWQDHKQAAFSCPICGVYSKLPGPDTPAVEAYVPEGEVRELDYRCKNCGEEFAIGTFARTPLHEVRFRACPNCEQKGFIERVGHLDAV